MCQIQAERHMVVMTRKKDKAWQESSQLQNQKKVVFGKTQPTCVISALLRRWSAEFY